MQENHIYDIDREAEAHGYATAQPSNFDLVVAKDSLIPTVESSIQTLIDGVENNEISGLDVFATFNKLVKIFNEAKQKVERHAMQEAMMHDKTFVIAGVEFTYKNGGRTFNYKEDFIIQELSQKIKDREELIKVALKSREPIFDSNGVEVTKVSSKPIKDSLSVKFKTK